jgi:hypothetical protein
MNALEVFGPSMTVILIAVAIGYFLLSFAPVIWPAFVAYKHRSWFPRPAVFVLVVAALSYGVFSFLAFAVLLPVELYGIFVAPSLESSGVASGASVLSFSGSFADYWWVIIPPAQLAITWLVTAHVGRRWAHICAAPPKATLKKSPSAAKIA